MLSRLPFALAAVVALLLMNAPAAASVPALTRVSVASDGTQGNERSVAPGVSANGRFVAFSSSANNFTHEDDSLQGDIFLHDTETGDMTLISSTIDGSPSTGYSGIVAPAVSDDGNAVAFVSNSTNLVPGDSEADWDVFVRDRDASATTRVGLWGNVLGDSYARPLSVTGDGRFVVFESDAGYLSSGLVGYHVLVHDLDSGGTTTASVASDGTPGDRGGRAPSISGDGRFVAFESSSTNLVAADTNTCSNVPGSGPPGVDVFVHDLQTGTTSRVSVDSNGVEANCDSRMPSLSTDGRYVAFSSMASNLVPGDTNGASDVFVHDRETGETTRVSIASDGEQTVGADWPSISGDGRLVAFLSFTGNTNVYVRDRIAGATILVSHTPGGTRGNYHSLRPSISIDGRFVAFDSGASDLVAGDTNNRDDVFLYDLDPDLDSLPETADNCPVAANPQQEDGDSDAVGDACDNCPAVANAGQENLDGDSLGDMCDPDDDGDAILDSLDNCPRTPNADQSDRESDGTGDVCDNCRTIPNADQSDTNSNGIGDVCDSSPGDFDCDFDIDAVDALHALRVIAGVPSDPVCRYLWGYTDCDGQLTAVDALRILRYVAGLETFLGCSGK